VPDRERGMARQRVLVRLGLDQGSDPVQETNKRP